MQYEKDGNGEQGGKCEVNETKKKDEQGLKLGSDNGEWFER